MLPSFIFLVVVGTTIWVGLDASRREWSDGFSTAAWVLGSLLLWIVVFPYYLVRRSNTPLKDSSVTVKGSFQHATPVLLAPTVQHRTPSEDDGPITSGISGPRCARCSGPIEPHVVVFGSNQCESCRGGKTPAAVGHASTSAPDPASEPSTSHTLRNTILAISGLAVLSLVGCSVLYSSAVHDATATHTEIVHVDAPPGACWSGAMGDSSKDGCGPTDVTISQSGPIAAANAQKQTDGDWQLTLSLEIGGNIVSTQSTTAEYGVAQVVGSH